MKKQLFLVAAIGVVGMALTSCGGGRTKTKFAGTISQHTEIQAYATLRSVRNLLDGATVEQGNLWKTGFSEADDAGGKLSTNDFMVQDMVASSNDQKNFLAKNFAITPDNASKYTDATAIDEGVKQLDIGKHPKKTVWIDLYNSTDNFLSTTYKPLLDKYAPLLNLELKWVMGDGNSETSVAEYFDASCDAYCINMLRTNNGGLYTSKITGSNQTKPLIWFNRQPSDPDTGVIDEAAMNHNPGKTFYVGFDAKGGGDVQGQMIVDYIKKNAAQIDKYGAQDAEGKDIGDGVIKYYLCIGDSSHNDSIARTKGIRRALGTLKDDSSDPNIKQEGSVVANDGKTYKIIEVQAAEMKDGASTWDANTAATKTDTWHTANPKECEMVISNNDGMGMAVYNKWAKAAGLPVFGYDANSDAVQAML